jgi:hypothetical protein
LAVAEGLLHNHSIMGIHLLGNEGEINGAGFVNAIDDTVK